MGGRRTQSLFLSLKNILLKMKQNKLSTSIGNTSVQPGEGHRWKKTGDYSRKHITYITYNADKEARDTHGVNTLGRCRALDTGGNSHSHRGKTHQGRTCS